MGEQRSFGAEVNECGLCGLEVGSVELEPGDMLAMTISVDDNVCSDGVLFSMAGMLRKSIMHGTAVWAW